MRTLVFYLGLMMIFGAGAIMNDYTKQDIRNGDQDIDFAVYSKDLQVRVTNYVTNDLGPAVAGLPDKAKQAYADWQNPPPETVEQTNRLAGLKERNTSIARNGVSIDDLTKMTPLEIYQNREAIMKGLTNQAKNTMSGVMK